jgi:ABC-2 type transport system ATP-binding protein
MPTGHVIEFHSVTKRFGHVTAVDGFSARIEPGAVTGFLGPNGAGKTTSMRMLLGLVRPTAGHATIGDRPYAALDRPLRTVGAALEASSFHPGRTARNHLTVYAQASGIPPARIDEVLALVGLADAATRKIGGYSTGMRQRLGLAQALLGDPGVLVLDEPANGLDPEGIRWLRGFLRHLSSQGKTVLISSHMLQEVEQTVDDVVIINNGRLIKQGAMESLHGEAQAIVRTSDLDALAGALRVADVTSQVQDGTLLAATHDLRLVGDVALRAGLPIYELRKATTDLEALFFELTEGTNRNLGGTAAPERDAITGQEGANG